MVALTGFDAKTVRVTELIMKEASPLAPDDQGNTG
jgi:hypothetical protein